MGRLAAAYHLPGTPRRDRGSLAHLFQSLGRGASGDQIAVDNGAGIDVPRATAVPRRWQVTGRRAGVLVVVQDASTGQPGGRTADRRHRHAGVQKLPGEGDERVPTARVPDTGPRKDEQVAVLRIDVGDHSVGHEPKAAHRRDRPGATPPPLPPRAANA